jgi:hypothetical protein
MNQSIIKTSNAHRYDSLTQVDHSGRDFHRTGNSMIPASSEKRKTLGNETVSPKTIRKYHVLYQVQLVNVSNY